MMEKQALLDHLDKLHTTDMGIDRIKKNLYLEDIDVVEYCKNRILDRNSKIYRRGKNWYCDVGDIKITIHANCYTIITAHIMK